MFKLIHGIKKPSTVAKLYLVKILKNIDSMHSFTVIHESRNLKQARFFDQYVDLLRFCARYSLIDTLTTLSLLEKVVNIKVTNLVYI